jgi:hypothetical protein
MSSDSNTALVRRFFDEVCNGRNPANVTILTACRTRSLAFDVS